MYQQRRQSSSVTACTGRIADIRHPVANRLYISIPNDWLLRNDILHHEVKGRPSGSKGGNPTYFKQNQFLGGTRTVRGQLPRYFCQQQQHFTSQLLVLVGTSLQFVLLVLDAKNA